MNKELLEKYSNNSCTEEELSSVLEWFEESARTPEGKTPLFKLWEEMPEEETDHQPDTLIITLRGYNMHRMEMSL